jgi:uncharacterized protein YbbC (DUF1343 family)
MSYILYVLQMYLFFFNFELCSIRNNVKMKELSIIVLLFLVHFFMVSQTSIVKTGIENLAENGFAQLKGKRIGLITNPTGINSQLKSTIDILFKSQGLKLVALYSPEHGVRGDFAAGDAIEGNIDKETKLPVYSLYGKNRKPSKDMLKGIDVLIYDIQDIGSRSYTFISTMGLAMEAAAENNIEFIVLDRPNPLGGNRIEGPLVEPAYISFVSQYPIPYIYGLTIGELAMYLNGEGLLKNGIKCKLTVIPMKGWKREMTYDKTGLPWVPTSPHIPFVQSPYYYAVSGILGELDANTIGIGYTLPFQVFAKPWIDAGKFTEKMNAYHLKGVAFRPIYFKPFYQKDAGKEYSGVQVYFTDLKNVKLTEIQFYIVQALYEMYPEHDLFAEASDRHKMFDQVCGSNKIREIFSKRFKYADIEKLWNDNQSFRSKSTKYFLY